MKKRYGVTVTGICRICGDEGKTEMHHIISQARCRKIGKEEWLNNSGNIVELCKKCHDNTTASLAYAKLSRIAFSQEYKFEGLDPNKCKIVYSKGKKKGQQCKRPPKAAHGLCIMHHRGFWIKKFYDSNTVVLTEDELNSKSD